MILISFPLGGCVDDVVNIQTNYQFTPVIVINIMNGAGACVLGYTKNCFYCVHLLNHSSRYKNNKLSKCHEKQRHQKAVFSKIRQFSCLSVFREL